MVKIFKKKSGRRGRQGYTKHSRALKFCQEHPIYNIHVYLELSLLLHLRFQGRDSRASGSYLISFVLTILFVF